jgi:TetR/AcrR family transcriptional repressor of lmrAB and yxaGH operons
MSVILAGATVERSFWRSRYDRRVAGDSKARIEKVSSSLLARRGYNGMGLKAVSEAAGLPFGSIYHHFPGGKEEIAAAAVTTAGASIEALLRDLFSGGLEDRGIRAMFSFMAGQLAHTDWAKGCPVGTPALDGSADSEPVRQACEAVLGRWVGTLADALVRDGLRPKAARDLATTMIAAYEGAVLLARVQRSDAPLTVTAEAMVRLARAARA